MLRREQGTAQAEIGPHSVLQVGEHDRAELLADRAGRGGHEHAVVVARRGQDVARQFGGEDLADELGRDLAGRDVLRPSFDEVLRRREEGHHGIQVAVRLIGRESGAERFALPGRRQPAALPHDPEQLLDGAVAGPDLVDRAGEALGPRSDRRVDAGQASGRLEHMHEQLVARGVVSGLELFDAQGEPQPPKAESVVAAERADQQLGGERGVELDLTDRHLDDRQQPPHHRSLVQHDASRRRARRHLGEREGPCHRRSAGTAADHDGEVAPRESALQVVFAQGAGDRRELPRRRGRLDGRDRRDTRRVVSSRDGCALRTGGRGADSLGRAGDERAEGRAVPVDPGEHHGLPDVDTQLDTEPSECVGLAPAERVARDVGVPERDDRDPPAAEGAEDRQRRLGRLVQVIDHDQAERRDPAVGAGGVDRGHGEARQFGRVELMLPRRPHQRVVPTQEVRRRDPFRAFGGKADLAQATGRDVVLGRARHQLAQLGTEPAQTPHRGVERIGPHRTCAIDDVAVEDGREVGILLRAGQQSGRLGSRRARGGRDDLEGERVDGAGERPVRRPRESDGDAIAQPGGGRPGGREHQDLVGLPVPFRSPGRRRARRSWRSCRCRAHRAPRPIGRRAGRSLRAGSGRDRSVRRSAASLARIGSPPCAPPYPHPTTSEAGVLPTVNRSIRCPPHPVL